MIVPLALVGITRWLPLGNVAYTKVAILLATISILSLSYFGYLVLRKNIEKSKLIVSHYCLIGTFFGLLAACIFNQKFWLDNGDYILLLICFIGIFYSYLSSFNKADTSKLNVKQKPEISRVKLYIKLFNHKVRYLRCDIIKVYSNSHNKLTDRFKKRWLTISNAQIISVLNIA